MKRAYRCWAEVDFGALRENLAWIRERVGPGVKILTVVKADAYGHGLREIAGLLMQSGTDVFGVANLAEAEAISRVGRGWPVLMLGTCLPEEVQLAVKLGVMPAISGLREAEEFSRAAVGLGQRVLAHIKVDTGLGRLGVSVEEAEQLVLEVRKLAGLELAGIFTHYASVESDVSVSARQKGDFETLLQRLRKRGVIFPMVHVNNSAAVLCEPQSEYTMVRPGLLVYGIVPPGGRILMEPGRVRVRPALSFYCRVGFVKEIKPGARLSYGGSFEAKTDMRVATLTAGYADGYPRAASNRGEVLVGGKRARIVGRITMDQMLVDVTQVPGVSPGDSAVLIGRDGGEEITASDVAGWSDTIPWEILTGITYRVPRIYRGGQAA